MKLGIEIPVAVWQQFPTTPRLRAVLTSPPALTGIRKSQTGTGSTYADFILGEVSSASIER